MIFAVPAPIAVITPPSLTIATSVFDVAHIRSVNGVSGGLKYVVSVYVVPLSNVISDTSKLIPVGGETTVSWHEADISGLSAEVTVIMAVPAETGDMLPFLSTVATAVLLDDQLTLVCVV